MVCHALPCPVLADACKVVLTRASAQLQENMRLQNETEHSCNYYTARGHTTTPKPTRRVKRFAQIPVNIKCNGHFLPVNTQFSRVSKNTISNSQKKPAKSNRATNKAQPSRPSNLSSNPMGGHAFANQSCNFALLQALGVGDGRKLQKNPFARWTFRPQGLAGGLRDLFLQLEIHFGELVPVPTSGELRLCDDLGLLVDLLCQIFCFAQTVFGPSQTAIEASLPASFLRAASRASLTGSSVAALICCFKTVSWLGVFVGAGVRPPTLAFFCKRSTQSDEQNCKPTSAIAPLFLCGSVSPWGGLAAFAGGPTCRFVPPFPHHAL